MLFRSDRVRRQIWGLCVIAFVMIAASASSVRADTRLFPIISISEQYDTNIFYAPKSLLAPQLKPEDYITFANPQLLLVHTSSQFAGSISVGGVIGKYVNNPDLDFAGFNAATTMNFSQMVQKFSRRITGLSVAGAYQFTPSASAFGGGGVGFGGVGFGTTGTVSSGIIGPFDSGLVANRAQITTYTGSINGGYALTPLTSLRMGYTFSRISFGTQFGLANEAQQNLLIDTTTHNINTGITTRLSPNDSVGVNYSYSTFQQSSGLDAFSTHTATGSWSRQWLRELGTAFTGGATLLQPYDDFSTGRPQRVPAKLVPTVGAVLAWTSASSALKSAGEGAFVGAGSVGNIPGLSGSIQPGTVMQRGRYSFAVSYNYSVFPSYVAQSGALQSHVFGASARAGLTDRITGTLGLNFARSIGRFGPTVFAVDTYGTTTGLAYLVTPNLQASLTHSWLNFVDKSPNPQLINNGLQLFDFSKHMVMLSLSYVFTPTPGFFRSGGLERAPSEGGSGSIMPGNNQGPGFGTSEKGLK